MNESPLQPGNAAFLCYDGLRIPTQVLAIAQDTVGVAAPPPPFPTSGQGIELEFETPSGVATYYTRVVICPEKQGDAMILMRAANSRGPERRTDWRVPVNLLTQVRRLSPPGVMPCRIVNLSSNGLLLEIENDLALEDVLDLYLALPGEPEHVVRVRVIREEPQGFWPKRMHRFGLLFVGMAAPAKRSLTHFMWQQLLKMFPRDMARRFPGGRAWRRFFRLS